MSNAITRCCNKPRHVDFCVGYKVVYKSELLEINKSASYKNVPIDKFAPIGGAYFSKKYNSPYTTICDHEPCQEDAEELYAIVKILNTPSNQWPVNKPDSQSKRVFDWMWQTYVQIPNTSYHKCSEFRKDLYSRFLFAIRKMPIIGTQSLFSCIDQMPWYVARIIANESDDETVDYWSCVDNYDEQKKFYVWHPIRDFNVELDGAGETFKDLDLVRIWGSTNETEHVEVFDQLLLNL